VSHYILSIVNQLIRLTLLFVIYSAVNANTLQFNHLNVKQGLADKSVLALTQDHQGFMWMGGYNGLSRFDGMQVKNIRSGLADFEITSLLAGHDYQLWIGTAKGGLHLYHTDTQSFNVFNKSNSELASNHIVDIQKAGQQHLWIITYQAIQRFDTHQQTFETVFSLKSEKELSGHYIFSALQRSDESIWIGSNKGVISLQLEQQSWHKISDEASMQFSIRAILKRHDGTFLFGGKNGLLQYDDKQQKLEPVKSFTNHYAYTLTEDQDNNIWVGTVGDGLFSSQDFQTWQQYRHHKGYGYSLAEDNVISMLIDQTGVLWLGGFHHGASYASLNQLQMAFYDNSPDAIACADNEVVLSVLDDGDTWWLGTEGGLVRYLPKTKQCKLYQSSVGLGVEQNIISDIVRDNNGHLILATGSSIKWFDEVNQKMVDLNGDIKWTEQIKVTKDNRLILSGRNGVYVQDVNLNVASKSNLRQSSNATEFEQYRFNKVGTNIKELKKPLTHQIIQAGDNEYWLASANGVLRIDSENTLDYLKNEGELVNKGDVGALLKTSDGGLYIAEDGVGLHYYNRILQPVISYTTSNGLQSDQSFSGLLEDKRGRIWIAHSQGISMLDPKTGQFLHLSTADGVQPGDFIRGAYAFGHEGKLFFAGTVGLNVLFPEHIKQRTGIHQTHLVRMTRFNKPVDIGLNDSDFSVPRSIEALEQIQLSHRDFVMGFQFAALDFAAPSQNQFAYKLEGFDPDWTTTNAIQGRVTYTNLPARDYVFRVKSANSQGQWSAREATLKVRVLPAPWMTWWAYSLYLTIALLILWGVIYLRTKAAKQRAKQLELEVDVRTAQIEQQKQTIESLLERKNELFANVSHEFRTPLTLILGPVNDIIRELPKGQMRSGLELVKQNGIRLLGLVEQLLKLARLSSFEQAPKVTIDLAAKLVFLVESFRSAADQKSIDLTLDTTSDSALNKESSVWVEASQDAIDTIVSNLIANALKYTPYGGSVQVRLAVLEHEVEIRVKDSGPGIEDEQQQAIFERFTRLQKHQHLEGSGLGLAVVKELTEINGGNIRLDSQIGQGSEFIISWPLANNTLRQSNFVEHVEQLSASDSIVAELNEELSHQSVQGSESENGGGGDDIQESKVLIIEDNKDMRHYIAKSLQGYQCIATVDGPQGIAKALEVVPDLIVCDVMMPGMDGFQVARIIRSDERTSHIPLVLLTARGDQHSRLKGWRENVDEYLTKPFDSKELRARIDNLLVLRDIRRQKMGYNIIESKDKSSFDLASKDRQFIDKLDVIIAKGFSDTEFGIQQMADALAVSERQLHRKLKALIDFKPSDYLREYRLKQAAKFLTDGNQVAVVSDMCGFVSTAHFSRRFKAQYGVSPKQYQETKKG